MKVQAACTYKATRQGSALDENEQIMSSAVVDLRFSLMMNIPEGSDNRATFAHLPGGEFSITGVKPSVCADISLGDVVEIEFTKVV